VSHGLILADAISSDLVRESGNGLEILRTFCDVELIELGLSVLEYTIDYFLGKATVGAVCSEAMNGLAAIDSSLRWRRRR